MGFDKIMLKKLTFDPCTVGRIGFIDLLSRSFFLKFGFPYKSDLIHDKVPTYPK